MTGTGPGKLRQLWRPLALLAAITAAFALALYFNVGERVGSAREWVASLGAWGPVVFGLIYAVLVVAAVPASALTVAAGALFGTVTGVVVVSLAATAGAALAFLVARYVARRPIRDWLSGNEKFETLDRMTEEHGAIIVAITRLVPIFPFVLLNYGFGLTRVRFRTYLFWSWLCMIPGSVLYVAGTDAVVQALRERKAPWTIIGVFAVALIVIVILARIARKRLEK